MADYDVKVLEISKGGNTYTYDAGGTHYAVCDTAAGTQTKAVTISEIASLTTGLSVRIKFSNAQTYNGQPKLQINSLTATNIVRMGTTAAARYEWNAGEILDFVYDGTNFIIQEGAVPTTTYYGSRVKLSSATNSTSEELAATPKAVKTAYDLANGKVSCTTANVKSALGTGTNDDTFLRKDGTWATPVDMRPIVVELGTLTNTSGSYTNTFTSANVASIANVVAGMKPIVIECGTPSAFQTAPTITTGAASITVQCDNFAGSSTLTVTLAQAVDATSATTYQLTSAEATTLQSQVGNPTSLTTTNKSNLVSAVNEVNEQLSEYQYYGPAQTSLLILINNDIITAGRHVPCTIQKINNAVITDLPSGVDSKVEFNANIFGKGERKTVYLSIFGLSSKLFVRDYFNGNWWTEWQTYSTYDENSLTVTNSSTTTNSTAPYGWTVTQTKSGYTAIMYSVNHSNSGSVYCAAENATLGNGTATVAGYSSSAGILVMVYVLWRKNV